MVEVRSKAKSKWRPQALDTVVCSGWELVGGALASMGALASAAEGAQGHLSSWCHTGRKTDPRAGPARAANKHDVTAPCGVWGTSRERSHRPVLRWLLLRFWCCPLFSLSFLSVVIGVASFFHRSGKAFSLFLQNLCKPRFVYPVFEPAPK